MFWHIFNICVFVFTIINTFVYFKNEKKSKRLIEDILRSDKNKKLIIQILSTDQEDVEKVKNLRKQFHLKLGESLDILGKYKQHKIN
ncbi:hypothetical protein [Apilactobacillus timberlakei]|uniref:hypothetical protein n=1 Tax=Apilactobacillus timberlakei TaxID=2008380 RepID=UPI00112B9BAF|nr:hypothetical protein [Apilactobacillus timberlakei]TPR13208.1 hypothetical protein DYZ97_04795 [Apilactobacillus timberlakei]